MPQATVRIQPQVVLNALMDFEQELSLVNHDVLYRALDACLASGEPLKFVAFSCLGAKKSAEELVVDFFQTLFFRCGQTSKLNGRARRVIQLTDALRDKFALTSEVTIILPDTEPRRTWGWQVPQEELTFSCELMREQAEESKLLPPNWRVRLWSEIEAKQQAEVTFDEVVKLIESRNDHATKRLIAQQKKHLDGYTGEYFFRNGTAEAAVRQVAAYAFEGLVLGYQNQCAILLQSEQPCREKDPLYQQLRAEQQLPNLSILHPFKD